MSDYAIKVEDLHKEFLLPRHKHTSLKEAFVGRFKRETGADTLHALKGVSFEIKKGEFFGVVGRNGSGKSTLLKTLAGVYYPTKGNMHINGKLVPFIELGVGFNPDLTGRDNVYLNGSLLGFSRKEISEMYDEIVDFSELERFMDQKLKNYSSGMQVRLAFSIAIRAQGDILLLDEVLAVGDDAFKRKCYNYFETMKNDANQTVVLVTHSMPIIQQYCDRALILKDGQVLEEGSPEKVTAR
ncbi:MAG: ABC transporter ATP-binding protein, partial [Candidatus Saccharimonadales bacterium]